MHKTPGLLFVFHILAVLVLILTAACAGTQPPAQANIPVTSGPQVSPTQVAAPGGAASEVVIYVSDLPATALSEWVLWDDPASPGGKLAGVVNTGEELDPPPENDPHVTFKVPVQSGIPYRCWIHMKVGAPQGVSQANMVWVQFSDAIDQANQAVFKPNTSSYLTAQGPAQPGWTWVRCDLEGAGNNEGLVHFGTSGEITVRLQAGMEGVGFDQFLLSPARYLENSPAEAVVAK